MICPHCRTSFHDAPHAHKIGSDTEGEWFLVYRKCPECNRFILELVNGVPKVNERGAMIGFKDTKTRTFAWPKGTNRPPCPPEVPSEFAEDYKEACLVLAESPKASAALSRRCLQGILREVTKVQAGKLYDEIEEAIETKGLPPHIADALHTLRTVGDLATHPTKNEQTGGIAPVEPSEAEWNLETLEALFDFYFVQPASLQRKKDALDKKLISRRQPPIT